MAANLKNHAFDVIIRYIDTNHSPNDAQVQRWLSWFDAKEQARLQRFQMPQHRQRFLLSHALLRGVLAEWADCSPHALQFATRPQGKPTLTQPLAASSLHFNLSHTHGMAAIAVSQRPVGLDLEWLQRRGPEVRLAQRYFSDNEFLDILAQAPERQHRQLLRYWTLKEAYIKAEGWGIAIGLDSFEFMLSQHIAPQLRINKPQAQPRQPWVFQQFELEPSHLLALAAVPETAHTPLRLDCAAWQP